MPSLGDALAIPWSEQHLARAFAEAGLPVIILCLKSVAAAPELWYAYLAIAICMIDASLSALMIMQVAVVSRCLALALFPFALFGCSTEKSYECVVAASEREGKPFPDNVGTKWAIKIGPSAALVEYWANSSETNVINESFPYSRVGDEITFYQGAAGADFRRSHAIHLKTLHYKSSVSERFPKSDSPAAALLKPTYSTTLTDKGSCRSV